MRRPALLMALTAWALAGCSVLSPAPTLELIKAAGSATALVLARSPTRANDTVHLGAPVPAKLCIEYNRQVSVPELVPALMAELRQHQVQARVFESGDGTPLGECPAWLRYQALVLWERPPLADDLKPYLAQINLSLHDDQGRLIGASRYNGDDNPWGLGRWASTRAKVAPVLHAVLTGFEG